MKSAVIVSLDQLITTNTNDTARAFQRLLTEKYGIDPIVFNRIWPVLYIQLLPLIQNFNLGWIPSPLSWPTRNERTTNQCSEITIKRFQYEFCRQVSAAFGVTFMLTLEEFSTAWCAMRAVTQEDVHDINTLNNNPDVDLFIHANIDPLHYTAVVKTLAFYEIKIPERNLFLSFRKMMQGIDLLKHAEFVMQNAQIDYHAVVYFTDCADYPIGCLDEEEQMYHYRVSKPLERISSLIGRFWEIIRDPENPSRATHIATP